MKKIEIIANKYQQLLISLNVFAMEIDNNGYTPQNHVAFAQRIADDYETAIEDVSEQSFKEGYEEGQKDFKKGLREVFCSCGCGHRFNPKNYSVLSPGERKE